MEPKEATPRDPVTEPRFIVITGMSGAGRSEAVHTFEDLGYFCIDNLPPAFIPQLIELSELPDSRLSRLAVVSDVRGAEFFDELGGVLESVKAHGTACRVLFLEADDDTLVNRFKETRRRHPLCDETRSLAAGIAAERTALRPVRAIADIVIDTSDLRPSELRKRLLDEFVHESFSRVMSVAIGSFGFKYGTPTDADVIMDVRFLPNPFYDPELRPLSGLDAPVRSAVLGNPRTIRFLEDWWALLDGVIPDFVAEGKTHLTVALGCTGGRHRSVALAEATAEHIRELGYVVSVSHRDINRDSARHEGDA